jgi:hypothetical protein
VTTWVAALATSTSVSAAIIHVDGSLPSSGNGSTWALAYNNLQTAISVAGPSDQIWVKAGTYKPGTTRSSSFVMKDSVKIFGGFAGTETAAQFALRDPVANLTILSGDIGVVNNPSDNCYHVVKATGPMVFPQTVLDGFTITGGNANDPRGIETRGGGIFIESTASGQPNACRPLIVRCVFIGNNASDDGGAVVAIGTSSSPNNICEPEFVNCAFYANGDRVPDVCQQSVANVLWKRGRAERQSSPSMAGRCNEAVSAAIRASCADEDICLSARP